MFGSAANWKASLNAKQLEAVTAGDGPILVIAGAGTGKTWTLACRVAHLVEQGVSPERILLLTFSRRAAKEMLTRADRLNQGKGTGKVWGGTFHAIANRLLRLYGRPLGLSPDFTVLDQADMADLIDLVRGEQHPTRDKHERRFPRKDTLVAIYSRMVNAGQPLSAVLEEAFPWCADEADGIRAIFAEYTRRKRAQNILDYDDLLLFWRALGPTPAGQDAARQFEHVLVDEYQDTNPLQAQILQSLRAENRNLMVVGDDAQAIYAFRAASIRNILDFPSQFPGARRITLEQNYRSTRPILDVSNAVIAYARERFPKDLWPVRSGGARPVLLTCSDESEQSAQVCEQILEHREQGTPLRQQAVLFRSGHHSDLLELELTRRNIPFVKYGGLKFLESAHIKDVLAVLRLLENPRDEVSWFRVLQLLDGIGPAGARAIMTQIQVRAAVPAVATTEHPASLEHSAGPEHASTLNHPARLEHRVSPEHAANLERPASLQHAASFEHATGLQWSAGLQHAASHEHPASTPGLPSSTAPKALPHPASQLDFDHAPRPASAADTTEPTDNNTSPRADIASAVARNSALQLDFSRVPPPPYAHDRTDYTARTIQAASSAGPERVPNSPWQLDSTSARAGDAAPTFRPQNATAAEGLPHPAARLDLAIDRRTAESGGLASPSHSGETDSRREVPRNGLAAAAFRSVPAPAAAGVNPLRRLIDFPPKVAEAAQEGLDRLREAFSDCLADGAPLPPAAEISRIRRFCEPIFLQRYSSPQVRLLDIEQLEQVAGAHSSRGRFLSELALDPPTSTSDLAGPPLLDEDYLILSTVHSAKGGEWDVVHVIHAADGMIPSDMSTGDKEAIEEERRLFYVALTRARDNLYVYFALRYYRRPRGLDDAHHFAQLTRFLPEPVQSLFERRAAGPAADLPAARSHAAPQQVEALLAALWDA